MTGRNRGTRTRNYGSHSTEATPLVNREYEIDGGIKSAAAVICILVTVAILAVPFSLVYSGWSYYRSEIDRLTPALENLRLEYTKQLEMQDVLRRSWANETETMRTQQERMRREWAKETAEWEDERRHREEERWREDEEKRDAEKRARWHIHWDIPRPAAHCARYGAREYTARLWNVPNDYDWIKACEKTPVAIHANIITTPEWCEVRDGVWGHWTVPFEEPECEARWDEFLDMGCSGEGLHRIEAKLSGIHGGENGLHLCETAPATIRGVQYDRPTRCFERNRDTIAMWEISDHLC